MKCFKNKDQIAFIQQSITKYKKIRPVGSNFGVSLYHNLLYKSDNSFYLSLKDYEFKPYMEGDIIICHPNNSLATVYEVAGKAGRMIYGTPFYYPISIGGVIFNGAVGGHVQSTNVASNVVALWMIDGLGNDCKIEGDELKYFLCTFGYLGIAYKIALKTYPQQYLQVNKVVVDKPFTESTHVSQMIFADIVNINNQIIPLVGDEHKPLYIDVVLEPVEERDVTNWINLKMQNIKKTALFLIDGITTTFHSAIMSSFMDIFIPVNGSVVNSRGLVDAYPLLPRKILEYIPLNLECGIYVDIAKLDLVLPIIEKYYRHYFYKNYSCINIVIRKIDTNNVCLLDATAEENGVKTVVLIDFGFFDGIAHKEEIDKEIDELLPYAYSFHLGKYVNQVILSFMKNKFNGKINAIKQKYDPNAIFSTPKLDELFM